MNLKEYSLKTQAMKKKFVFGSIYDLRFEFVFLFLSHGANNELLVNRFETPYSLCEQRLLNSILFPVVIT